ncbi:TPA: hypothetical protein ACWXNI_005408 [Escherichia coli]|uniref:Uncharacterized protein n=1 Tax=Escherichia coli TaxID=562 RepID=A0A4V5GQ87_ECOLX|nr:hypothetical protein [Escherichia coli]EKF4585412.1 hypothetical protein [Escherichia coli O26]EKH5372869.1 hypothetical protein [Escherichia coli O33]EKY2583661.1 hypothetical protein [Escherichia coli O91]HCS2038462.1 hypothetical protein [Shigella sonnei]EED1440411.1 hypothetical protein [Escherichia coli]
MEWWLMISDKLITLAKILCVIVGIPFLVMLVAIFFSTAWRVLTLSGLVG